MQQWTFGRLNKTKIVLKWFLYQGFNYVDSKISETCLIAHLFSFFSTDKMQKKRSTYIRVQFIIKWMVK